VLGAAWIADLGPQPLLGMLQQVQGTLTGLGAGGGGWLITAQQLNERRSELFGRPSGPLCF